MEENREPLSAIAIEKKLQLLRNKHFSEDTIALVKSDYEYGLTEEEISLYLNKSYDIEQMKILSECLHKDVPKDVINIIKNTKYSAHQMQVSLEFYEKGVPVQTIKEVMDKGEKPITMRRLYEEVLEQLNKVKEQIPEESEYVKALISQMDEVVAKINHQNERYDALNKKLSEIETSKDDEQVRERLVKENQDKEALINSQQNELNKASSTIARLRDDIEKKDKEMKRMGDRIESLEDKIISVATENKKEAESKAEPQDSQSVPQADKKMVDTVAVPQNMQAVANGIPVYYQIPGYQGSIGLISAMHGKFCGSCNRIRLTSTGFLKTCLCYEDGTDLRKILRGERVQQESVSGCAKGSRTRTVQSGVSGTENKELLDAMARAIYGKPAEHCFEQPDQITEAHGMSAIGG